MLLLALAAASTYSGSRSQLDLERCEARERQALTSPCLQPRSQRDLTRCSVAEREAADIALNQQYGAAITAMKASDAGWDKTRGPGYEETLREAQRAWLIYRDAHCRSEGYRMRGGSAESMAMQLCLTTVTRARTKQLHDLISEG